MAKEKIIEFSFFISNLLVGNTRELSFPFFATIFRNFQVYIGNVENYENRLTIPGFSFNFS